MKRLWIFILMATLFVACSENKSSEPENIPVSVDEQAVLGGFAIDAVDMEKQEIHVKAEKGKDDSLDLSSIASVLDVPENYQIYLGNSGDPDDPEVVDWNSEVKGDFSISTEGKDSVYIVVMNEKNEVIDIWTIVLPEKKISSSPVIKSSSSSEVKSSSSEALSSSSVESVPSTVLFTTIKLNVSTKKMEKDEENKRITATLKSLIDFENLQVKMCVVADGAKCSIPLNKTIEFQSVDNSYVYDFSVEEPTGEKEDWKFVVEAPLGYMLEELVPVYDDVDYEWAIQKDKVDDKRVLYIEFDNDVNLAQIDLRPMGIKDLRNYVEVELVNEEGSLETFLVKGGKQLPGTKFDAINKNIWASTSDAMAKTSSYAPVFGVIGDCFESSANLMFDNSVMTISSKEVVGKGCLTGIAAVKKLAGGFYFTGTYNPVSEEVMYIYDQGYEDGTPSTEASNISKDMSIGVPFDGRPLSFTVKYSYAHKSNSSKDYPQKFLIYVMLVGEDNKVIAAGFLTGNEDVEMTEGTVDLSYDKNAIEDFLKLGFPLGKGAESLAVGNPTDAVSSIRVMFASSAYAFVVENGSSKYRGSVDASLSVDEFTLNY